MVNRVARGATSDAGRSLRFESAHSLLRLDCESNDLDSPSHDALVSAAAPIWSFPRKFFRCQVLRLRVRKTRFPTSAVMTRDRTRSRAKDLLLSRNAYFDRVWRTLDMTLAGFFAKLAA
jgi:hypothetical protein